MAPKLSKLAKQYKKALDELEIARKTAEQARSQWLDEAASARTALLEELAEFGQAAGLDVDAAAGRLTLGWRGRALAVTEGSDADTLDTDAGTRLVVTPDGDWFADTGSAREPLVDRGLRLLLVDALGVPDPEGELGSAAPARAPSKAPARAPAKSAAAATPPVPHAVIAAPEPEIAGTKTSTADGRGPGTGEIGHLGRSGTRGFKRAKDISPGGLIKDLKGPGPV